MGGTTRDLRIRVAKGIIIFNLIVIAGGAVLLKNWKPFVIGNILGFMTAIINFKLLSISIERLLTKRAISRGGAIRYTGSRAFVRFLISGVVIYLSLTLEYINTIGTVIGLLSIKPVILIQSFLYK